MRIVSLNLRQGGGRRVGGLSHYLLGQRADVIVAPEYRHGPTGDALIGHLRAGGWASFHVPQHDRGKNTVLLATRTPSTRLRLSPAPCDGHRIVAATVAGAVVAGVYFAQRKEKTSLFDYLLAGPPELSGEAVLVGDMNTGAHSLDENGESFHCADRFCRLGDAGYADLWRQQNGASAREFTWISNKGNGFRIDHAFASHSLAKRVSRCEYDHSTRPGITDHSALIVEFGGA